MKRDPPSSPEPDFASRFQRRIFLPRQLDLEGEMLSKEAWVDIKSLHRQGLSIRGIARELDISRKTVRRYLRSEALPRYLRTKKRASLLDPYKDYLRSRLEALPEWSGEALLPATVLLREIQAQGYQGKITLVKDFVQPLRAER